MKPMLADSVEINGLDTYITSDLWVAQQKMDGDRIMIEATNGKVVALNRKGEPYRNPMPQRILRQFERMQGHWVFDGELMDELWLFDLPLAGDYVSPSRDLSFRTAVLDRFFAGWAPDPCVRLLPTARSTEAKCSLVEQVVAMGGEGVMFKRLDAPYVAGKRSASMLKGKFTKTADVVVTKVSPEGRANCHYAMFDNGRLVEVGSCATAGKPRVSPGDVIEVLYLYAGTDGRLVQPRMVGLRPDKAASDCTIDQLQFTSRDVVVPDERPVRNTSASFVSQVLSRAGLEKGWAGFEVHRKDGRILVYTRFGDPLGRRVQEVLSEHDMVLGFRGGEDGRFVTEVRGRRR